MAPVSLSICPLMQSSSHYRKPFNGKNAVRLGPMTTLRSAPLTTAQKATVIAITICAGLIACLPLLLAGSVPSGYDKKKQTHKDVYKISGTIFECKQKSTPPPKLDGCQLSHPYSHPNDGPVCWLANAIKKIYSTCETFFGNKQKTAYFLPKQQPIPPDDCQLLPAPTHPIYIGICNPSQTTCWLNSSIKFLATTQWGDDLCATPANEEELLLQNLLKKIMVSFRAGLGRDPISHDLITQFLAELAPLMPKASLPIPCNSSPPNQEDAAEFLHLLIGRFNHLAKDRWACEQFLQERCAQRIAFYDSVEPGLAVCKRPALENFTPLLMLKCEEHHLAAEGLSAGPNTSPLDINALVEEHTTNVSVHCDSFYELETKKIFPFKDDEVGDSIVTKKAYRLVHAPQKLLLSINRAVSIEHLLFKQKGRAGGAAFVDKQGRMMTPPSNTARYPAPSHFVPKEGPLAGTEAEFFYIPDKCKRPILFTSYQGMPATVLLHEYDSAIEFASAAYASARPKYNCYYQVKGAIVHQGKNAHCGHYVYLQHLNDERFLLHSDEKVYEVTRYMSLLRKAVFLELELVAKTPWEETIEQPTEETIIEGALLKV